jgi:hypothetical protein
MEHKNGAKDLSSKTIEHQSSSFGISSRSCHIPDKLSQMQLVEPSNAKKGKEKNERAGRYKSSATSE